MVSCAGQFTYNLTWPEVVRLYWLPLELPNASCGSVIAHHTTSSSQSRTVYAAAALGVAFVRVRRMNRELRFFGK